MKVIKVLADGGVIDEVLIGHGAHHLFLGLPIFKELDQTLTNRIYRVGIARIGIKDEAGFTDRDIVFELHRSRL